jgi:(S)-ureidoglycine aminohydrolase
VSMPLIQTARTRSVLARTHLLHTPESFVRTPMPGLQDGMAVVHACPDLGARFLWFMAELEAGGTLAASQQSRFIFILAGSATLSSPDTEQPFEADSYAFSSSADAPTLKAISATRCVVIEKRYEALPDVPVGAAFVGHEADVAPVALGGDTSLQVRALMPASHSFDFAVNTMTYEPGAALPQVEVHYMEHGLLMLEGEGIYLLGDQWHVVQAGDFIWMAPYCPQWFVATGSVPAKYLIYKNFNRKPAL